MLGHVMMSSCDVGRIHADLRDDNSRGKDAMSRKDRPDNRLHMKQFLQRLGAKIICLPNSGDCFFAQHAVPSMSGRGRGRKESLGPEEILEVRCPH